MNISFSELMAGFLFGTIGLFLLREAKKRSNLKLIPIAILLMGYSYFVDRPIVIWGLGAALCYAAYVMWE